MPRLSKKKYLLPLTTFIMTMFVSAVVVYVSYQSQLKYSRSLFHNLAEKQTENLQQVVDGDLQFIGAGANFYHSIRPENWDRFGEFADELVGASETLIGLQWMQKVEKYQLEAHVAKTRETYPDFQPYTVPKHGPKTLGYAMPSEQPIYIASDVYPRSPANLSLLGFYSSRNRFELILDGLKATGEPHVSDKLRLIQDGLDRQLKKNGFLIYHPVFDYTYDKELIGVVIGVIRNTQYFEDLVIRTASEQELLIKVTDQGYDAEDDPILYQSEGWAENQGMEITKRITLPNREWLIDFKLVERISNNDRLVLRGLLLGGLLVSVLLSYIALLMVRDKEHLAVLLDERTEELRFLVNHDALTGLQNRRSFNQTLHHNVMNMSSFALVGFDIDRFKLINDQFGHIVGDEMLCHVTSVVKDKLLAGDSLYRLGGDEFCILSKLTDSNELFGYLNDICRAVATTPIEINGKQIRCTLSIGAAVRTIESEEDIMQLADAQLYHSKQTGRNRVSVAG